MLAEKYPDSSSSCDRTSWLIRLESRRVNESFNSERRLRSKWVEPLTIGYTSNCLTSEPKAYEGVYPFLANELSHGSADSRSAEKRRANIV